MKRQRERRYWISGYNPAGTRDVRGPFMTLSSAVRAAKHWANVRITRHHGYEWPAMSTGRTVWRTLNPFRAVYAHLPPLTVTE